jgi:multidrug transporter EmrE-like cation transporter
MNNSLTPYYFYIVGTVLCTIYGQLILKWRIGVFGPLPPGLTDKIIFLLKLILDPFIFSGLFAAFVASMFWMAAVTRLDLSTAYPLITAGLTTFTVILAIVVLKEPLSFSKVMGLLLIVSGVVVMVKDAA